MLISLSIVLNSLVSSSNRTFFVCCSMVEGTTLTPHTLSLGVGRSFAVLVGCPLVGLSQVLPLVASWNCANASGGTRRRRKDPCVRAGQPDAVLRLVWNSSTSVI